mmetsp:Transcript_126035/g.362528  ORF Transcript_126035/g.362528 Transcript_126035/m.362528 type:complete len:369 (+) Transcript_126035:475-1581(+)
MAGVQHGVARELEDTVVHRLVQPAGIALLEVCAAATADQHGVACEDHARRPGQRPRDASVRVPRGRDGLELETAEGDAVLVVHQDIGLRTGSPRDHRLHIRQLLFDDAAGGDVVGMTMCVDHISQGQALLAHDGQISVLLLQHGVDKHTLRSLAATQEVGVRGGNWVEQLREDQAVACLWLQHGSGVEGGQLLQQPLAHRPALSATVPELHVGVHGELRRGLGALAVLLREPEEQQNADAVAAGALEHHWPWQAVEGLQGFSCLLLGRHLRRAWEGADLDVLDAGFLQLLGEEVLCRIQVHPRLVPRRQGDGSRERQLATTSDIAGDVGRLDVQLLQRKLLEVWRVPLRINGPKTRVHGLGDLLMCRR